MFARAEFAFHTMPCVVGILTGLGLQQIKTSHIDGGLTFATHADHPLFDGNLAQPRNARLAAWTWLRKVLE